MKLQSCLLVAAIIMSEGQELNLESWMENLPEQLKNVPLIYLAIPGSHDSMTYGITRSSGLAPDAEPIWSRLYPLFRGTILRWTITQTLDTMQQLLIGIRYFDLRLATKPYSDEFYFTHGLYAEEISTAMEQVKSFVDTHPGEVVILDLQHFYAFMPEDHYRLMRYLLKTFGPKIVPKQLDLRSVTLNSLNRLKQQIIIVYRNSNMYEFWGPHALPSPWPQEDRPRGLIEYLESVQRNPSTGFVHQAVLTPTPTFIVLRWTSNLRDKCAAPVVKTVLPRLAQFSPGAPTEGQTGPSPVNIVIADFVDIADAIFPRTIIRLNNKLLRNTDVVYHSYG